MPFKPLFPAPTHFAQTLSTGSPLLFQQNSNSLPPMNPLFQPPSSMGHLPPSLLQPTARPPSVASAFQSPPSAFTPLNPSNNLQSSSLIQPRLTIGSQPPPLVPSSQPLQFPLSKIPTAQGNETAHFPPSTMVFPRPQDMPLGQSDVHVPPPMMMKDTESPLAPPPPPPPTNSIR